MNIGILGAGQLGRMLALSGAPLGLRTYYLGEDQGIMLAAQSLGSGLDDLQGLERFLARCDAVTYETEHIPESVQRLVASLPCRPGVSALFTLQNRLRQKIYLANLGLPIAEFMSVDTQSDLGHAADRLGYPFMLKSASNGYDGRGQFVVRSYHDMSSAWRSLGPSAPLCAERFIHFQCEFSALAARATDGTIVHYPPAQNFHHHGILVESVAPAPLPDALVTGSQMMMERLLESLRYVGILAIEFFATSDGLWVNEVAPRVHNSGHWTMDGATTSQFENHMRAVAGLPLGPVEPSRPVVMHNIIGSVPSPQDILRIPGTKLHLYDKQARPGRKLGHINLVAETPERLLERNAEVRAALAPSQIFAH